MLQRLLRFVLVVALAATGLVAFGSRAAHASAPPVLASFSLSPTSVDVSSSSQQVTATLHITDSSGFYYGYVYLYSPDGNYNHEAYVNYYDLTSGTSTDGYYQVTITLPQYSERGTWTTQVELVDYSYNYVELNPSATVAVSTTQQDTTAPVIAGLTYSPSSVDTSTGNATVTATVHITDDLSGFNYGYLYLTSPNGQSSINAYLSSYYRTSGSAQDGIYQVSLTFPEYSQQGKWTSSATIYDQIGNSSSPRPAATVSVGVSSVPGPPTDVTASPGNGRATVSWTAPTTGSAPTSYTVVANPGGQTVTITGNPPATSATVTGLTNGTSYTFTVSAANGSGVGPSSSSSAPVTPLTTPGAPTGVTATAGDMSASVSWTAPSNGGSPITSYTVTASPGGATATVSGSPSPTSVSVTGLSNGTAYTFTVVATNAAGSGPGSAPSGAVTPVGAPPGPPQAVQGLAGPNAGQNTVFWQAPAMSGTSSVTGYDIFRSVGGGTATEIATTTATSYTDAGLTPDVIYTYTVTAVNSSGQSSPGTAVQLAPALGPALVVSDTSVVAPPSGQNTTATFTVSISGTYTSSVSVKYATQDGTAIAGRDYTATSGTLTFSPGTQRLTVPVTVLGTGFHNDGLSFGLVLSSATGAATIPDATATASIVDRLGLIPVSVGSAYVQKSASSSTTLQVPVSVASTPASGETVSVTLETVNGTAKSPKDYTAVTKTVTFTSSSASTQYVSVTIPKGKLANTNTMFDAVLSSVSSDAEIAAPTGVETIVNKGGAPEPSLEEGDATVLETTGQQTVLVPISLSAATTKPVSVSYTTADGTRVAGSGYQPSSGTVTIPAGQTSTSIPITVFNDGTRTLPQSFTVQYSSPTNALLPDPQSTITVIDPDGPYRIRISDAQVTRPVYGPPDSLLFTVNLVFPVADGNTVTVDYTTSDGTAIAARGDYTPVSGTLTFTGGQSSQTVAVPIPAGTATSPELTVHLNLSDPSVNATLADSDGLGRITSPGPIPPATWNAESSGTTANLHSVSFANPLDGWAVGDSGTIVATTNGGGKWTAESSGTSNNLQVVDFASPNNGWAAGADGTIVSTSNGGSTWTAQTSGTTNQLTGISFVSKTQGWIVGLGGVILTTSDGGAHWTPQTSSTGSSDLRDVDFVDPLNGYAVGGSLTKANKGVIIRTQDGGVTWKTITSTASSQVTGIAMADPTHGYASATHSTAYTTVDGATFTARGNLGSTILTDVAAVDVDRATIVGLKGEIYTTVDEGQTYTTQASGTTQDLDDVTFLDPWHGWAVGDGGTILGFG